MLRIVVLGLAIGRVVEIPTFGIGCPVVVQSFFPDRALDRLQVVRLCRSAFAAAGRVSIIGRLGVTGHFRVLRLATLGRARRLGVALIVVGITHGLAP